MAETPEDEGWVLYPPLDREGAESAGYGTSFFDPNGGGDPVWLQHVFWVLGHWEIYSILLMLLAVMAVSVLTPFPNTSKRDLSTLLVPDLISGLYLGGIALFLAANFGLTWRMNNMSMDSVLHDTYYIVVHWHYALVVLTLWAVIWSGYRLFDKIMGVRYKRAIGVLQFVCFAAGISLIFLPQFFLIQHGMPQRYVDYQAEFTVWNRISSFGYILALLSLILFLALIVEAMVRRHGLKKQK
ncbi:MAG: hypothetical protein CMK09_06375 [Ponticaulis sp.]|nr:hypothetical protein [Ponticaulis sp.]|tara:strand:- start:1857 stop:2579 length:723 start_codon:yes stop_codon:yes gene_type:complete